MAAALPQPGHSGVVVVVKRPAPESYPTHHLEVMAVWPFTRSDDYEPDPYRGKAHAWGDAPAPVKHPKVKGPTAVDDRTWFDRARAAGAAVNGVWRGDNLPAEPAPSWLTDWWNGR